MTHRHIDDDQRRARLATRHRLVPALRSDDVASITGGLTAIHSSDPATVYLSYGARMLTPSIEVVHHALYEQRCVVRHHAMRRTMWVMTPEVARLAHAATTLKVERAERKKLLAWIEDVDEIDDSTTWLDEAMGAMESLIAARGAVTARAVGQELPQYAIRVDLAQGTKNAFSMNLHPKVLQHGGFRGRLVRTEPTGSWISSEYRWAATESWLGQRIDDLTEEEAAGPLLDTWLRSFGPATTTDIRWYFGWTAGLMNKALAACEGEEVTVDSGAAFVASADDGEVETVGPWVALLPGLDATTMGWKERDFYLDPAMIPRLFDRFGNAGPTIWADGRVVGGWIQRDDGQIVLDVLTDLDAAHHRLLDAEVDRTTAFLGDTVVRPRFPSPNQKSLVA